MKEYNEISAEEANEWKLQHEKNLLDLEHSEFERLTGIESSHELSEDDNKLDISEIRDGVSATPDIVAFLIILCVIFILGYIAVNQLMKGEYLMGIFIDIVTVGLIVIDVSFLKTVLKKIAGEREYKRLLKKGVIKKEKKKYDIFSFFTDIMFLIAFFVIGSIVLLWVIFILDEKYGIL